VEVKAARLEGKGVVDKLVDTGDGGWELCSKRSGDPKEFSFSIIDCLR